MDIIIVVFIAIITFSIIIIIVIFNTKYFCIIDFNTTVYTPMVSPRDTPDIVWFGRTGAFSVFVCMGPVETRNTYLQALVLKFQVDIQMTNPLTAVCSSTAIPPPPLPGKVVICLLWFE